MQQNFGMDLVGLNKTDLNTARKDTFGGIGTSTQLALGAGGHPATANTDATEEWTVAPGVVGKTISTD